MDDEARRGSLLVEILSHTLTPIVWYSCDGVFTGSSGMLFLHPVNTNNRNTPRMNASLLFIENNI